MDDQKIKTNREVKDFQFHDDGGGYRVHNHDAHGRGDDGDDAFRRDRMRKYQQY